MTCEAVTLILVVSCILVPYAESMVAHVQVQYLDVLDSLYMLTGVEALCFQLSWCTVFLR